MPLAEATLAAAPDLRVTTYCPATTSAVAASTWTSGPAWAGVATRDRARASGTAPTRAVSNLLIRDPFIA
jgi:hypothetical protein